VIELSSQEERVEKLLEKHPPLSPQQVREKERDKQAAITKYRGDIAKAEENLVNYLNKLDPLVDPGTDTAIAWIRRLPYKQLIDIIPDDLLEAYRADDKATALKLAAEKYMDYTYELMAKLIAKPEHDKDWWAEHINIDFVELFQARLIELMSRLEEQTDFF